MGVVYEARQISLDRPVALKILPFAAVLDAKQIARFKNEAQAAAADSAPQHRAGLRDRGGARGVHYYAMQLIDDQPLDRAITQLRGDSDDAVSNSTTPAADVNTVRAPSSGAVGPPPVRS